MCRRKYFVLSSKATEKMGTENSDIVAKLESVIQESKKNLERLHGIRIMDDAIVCAARLGKQHFSHNLSEQELQEKVVYIVNEACLIMRKKFLEHEDEIELDEREYILRRALIEYNELVKEKSFFNKYWLARVMNELKDVSNTLGALLKRWKTLSDVSESLSGFFEPRTIYNDLLSTFERAQMKKNHSDFFIVLQRKFQHLNLLEQRAQNIFRDHLTIGARHVAEVVSALTGIPVPWLCSPIEHGYWMTDLNRRLHERVIDQDHVIDAVLKAVFSAKEFSSSPMHVSRRPLASFLFLGPSGVGKTELAKSMAKHLFSDVNRLIRIDMSEYADLQSFSSLLDPSAALSNGAQKSGLLGLAEVLRVNPYSLILFDKIEMAHSSVVEALLPILTDGELTTVRGQTLDFSKTIIIMTSNVEASQLHLACSCLSMRSININMEKFKNNTLKFDKMHNCKLKGSGPERVLEEARSFLSHDLLQSLDDVVVFDEIYHVEAVARLILRDNVREFADLKLVVHPSDAMLDAVSLHVTEQPVQAGKAIKGWLDENVVPVLSKMLRDSDEIDEYPTIYIDTFVGTKELSFRLESSRYIAEDWSLTTWNASLRKFRATYRKEKEREIQICRLICMNSRLVDMVGDGKSHVDMGSLSLAPPTVEDWPLQDEGSIQAVPSCMVANTCHREEGAKEKVKSLRSRLQERIRGQHQAIDLIANAIMGSIDAPLDLTKNRPSQCFLFVGLTSFGKMGLIKGLSELLLSDDGKSMLIQIDLSEYAEPQSRLFSVPLGISSNEKCGFWMLEAVKTRPYSVLLFDQVEKANASVFKTLLRVLDTGLFTDDQGLVVDFRTTTIIFTTDLGNKTVIARLYCRSDLDNVKEGVEQGMSCFRSELLNRMDEIIFFNPLSHEQKDIARLPMVEDCHEKESSRLFTLPSCLYYIFCKKNDPIFERFERSTLWELALYRISKRFRKDWDDTC